MKRESEIATMLDRDKLILFLITLHGNGTFYVSNISCRLEMQNKRQNYITLSMYAKHKLELKLIKLNQVHLTQCL